MYTYTQFVGKEVLLEESGGCIVSIAMTNWMVICGNNRLLLLNLACGCMWILLCMEYVCGVSNSDPIVESMLLYA